MKIAFLVRALNYGGAQSQLVILAQGLKKRGHTICVIAFYNGIHARELSAAGINVHLLNKRGRWDVIGLLWRLTRLIRAESPDILYGYLATCNLLTGWLQFFFRHTKAVWGIRVSDLNLHYYDRLSRYLAWLEIKLSGFAALVIANSEAGKRYAISQGWKLKIFVVIHNGIEVNKFQPNIAARKKVRAEWNVTDDELLIGIVGRIDPIKGHRIFLQAAAQLIPVLANVRFVCVGDAVNQAYQKELLALTEALGLQQKVIWAAARYDLPDVYNGLDVLTNCSASEGFSNVIGEAMACGISCVVTKVGDSAEIVGDAGIVIEANNPAALVTGWLEWLRRDRQAMGRQARQRISEMFSVQKMVDETEAVLLALT